MKQRKPFLLPKISADQIAKNLRSKFPKNKLTGEDKALQIARHMVKNVGFLPKSQVPIVSLDDVDATFFTRKEIFKNAHIWTQVHAILQKG